MSNEIILDEVLLDISQSDFARNLKKFDIEPTKENIQKYYDYDEEIYEVLSETLTKELYRIAEKIAGTKDKTNK